MLKNVAVYLRVSTEEQSKHWGVQAQLSSCKKYCRENKLAIAAMYTDIISGATSNRPGFQQMLIDAKQKSFSMIVVAKLDRLARDLYLQIGTIEDLRGHGSVDDTDVVDPVDQGGQLRDERIGQGIGDVRSSYRILVLDADRDDLGLALHLHGGHVGELFHGLGQPERVDRVLQDGTAGDDFGIRHGKSLGCLDLAIVDTVHALRRVLLLIDDERCVGLVDGRQDHVGQQSSSHDCHKDDHENDPETTTKNAKNIFEIKCVFHDGNPLQAVSLSKQIRVGKHKVPRGHTFRLFSTLH